MNLPNNDGSNKDDTAFMNMEVISGTYQFKIQYSKTKHICKVNDDNCITSPIFKVNGHDCKILYFPPGSEDTIVLKLAMPFSIDEHFVPSKRFVNGIMPFSIDEHFVQLLDRKETADVKFEVEGEIFIAHRSILAARSPVFNAEFFGSMVESNTETITIKEIKATVFKAMLHFIYTDSLPDMFDENTPLVTMTQHLLVAADRYALDGLKMLCEDRLMRDITMDTALSTLTLAEELNLKVLKYKCICFVSDKEKLVDLSVTDDYVQLMIRYASLLKKIRVRVRG